MYHQPHSPLIETVISAKLREVLAVNNRAIGGNDGKGALFSFGNSGFIGGALRFSKKRVPFARWEPISVLISALSVHVQHIVGLRTKEKMARIDTAFVVAAMQDKKRSVKIPVGHSIGNPMNAFDRGLVQSRASVSGSVKRASPYPAISRFLDLVPKFIVGHRRMVPQSTRIFNYAVA